MMNNKVLFTMIYHFFMKPGICTHTHTNSPTTNYPNPLRAYHSHTNQPTNQPTYLTLPTCIAQPVRGPSHYRCISSSKK